jgi:hypothetical protein
MLLYKTLVGNLRRKKPLGRHTLMWEDNIRMVLKHIGYELIHLDRHKVQWRALGNTVMNLIVPWREGSFLTIVPIKISRMTKFIIASTPAFMPFKNWFVHNTKFILSVSKIRWRIPSNFFTWSSSQILYQSHMITVSCHGSSPPPRSVPASCCCCA